MLIDGHSATPIASRLGICANLFYRSKTDQLAATGPVAKSLESRMGQWAGLAVTFDTKGGKLRKVAAYPVEVETLRET